MPGIPGPTPKDPSKRARTNEPTFPTTELEGAPAKAPALPRGKWLAATKVWWKVWKESPQAKLFTSTDWLRLIELLPTVDAYFRGDLRLLTEIRQNEGLLGATPKDRLQLRWRFREMAKAEEKAAKTGERKKRRRDPRLKVLEGGS